MKSFELPSAPAPESAAPHPGFSLIQTNARPEQLQMEGVQHGHLRTLRQDGICKVLGGHTTIDEVRANSNG